VSWEFPTTDLRSSGFIPTQIASVKSRRLAPDGCVKGSIDYGTIDLQDPRNNTAGHAADSLVLDAWNGSEVTRSENHPDWKSHKSGSWQGDLGGEFFNQKQYVVESIPQYGFSSEVIQEGRYKTYCNYSGPVLPEAPGVHGFPSYFNSSNTTLDAWGSKAIAACKPTNSVADASVFLGELMREGVRDLFHPRSLERMRDVTREARKVPAETYLQYQFGWKPVAQDAAAIAAAVLDRHVYMTQFERDSGKLVRRRFAFKPVVSEQTDQVGTDVAVYLRPSHAVLYSDALPKGRVYRTRTSLTSRWFSGGFTYYTPKDYGLRSDITRSVQMCKKVFGLSFTPDVVWNLAPWSWAADWFTNIGDVLSNISDAAIYGLVLKYGYMMEHTMRSDKYVFAGPNGLRNSSILPIPITLVSETKVRRKATPFGFGLTWNGFNPFQLSIAAALGLSRS
jgi:hypothetical protein